MPATVSRALMDNGHDYLFIRSPRTWYEASALCTSFGYSLVTLNDDAEQAFLRGMEGSEAWWIGANALRTEGSWLWSQGRSSYTHWGAGQPDSTLGNKDCVQDNDAGSGRWRNESCITPLPLSHPLIFQPKSSTIPGGCEGQHLAPSPAMG